MQNPIDVCLHERLVVQHLDRLQQGFDQLVDVVLPREGIPVHAHADELEALQRPEQPRQLRDLVLREVQDLQLLVLSEALNYLNGPQICPL